jgi:hypothetical protein
VTRPQELDTGGRRLRAALAAVPVRDNAQELRLVREGSSSAAHDGPGVGRPACGLCLVR